ncbi:BTB/POZ domain-containing adapter for CUL3-mediated RhoA degradation protein 1 [Galdieria sulphuraria]|nr:BTB/POZ domain-containing adapter for CUL3-mediated RhoA degradation protein 1 [Galdieria sulphuraria]
MNGNLVISVQLRDIQKDVVAHFGNGMDAKFRCKTQRGRDGDRFRHILNYLRCGTVHIGEDIRLLGEILEEAEYFGLQSLAQQLKEALLQCRVKQEEKESSVCGRMNNEDNLFHPMFEPLDGFSSSQTSQGEPLLTLLPSSQEFRLDEDF